jgi:hypothetical protein
MQLLISRGTPPACRPPAFIIGRDGKVLANHLGYGDSTVDELVADINHAFAEPTVKPTSLHSPNPLQTRPVVLGRAKIH